LLIAILLGMAIYQVVTIRRIHSINQTLRGANFQNALTCLQALRDRDLVEEYAGKYFKLVDEDYRIKFKESQKDYETQIDKLVTNAVSKEERVEAKLLEQLWISFLADLRLQQQGLPLRGTDLPEDLQNALERLRIQTFTIYQASLNSIAAEVEKSGKASDTAELILFCSVLVALVISIPVSFLIYRSISNPLAHLTEGTRAIAEGKFYYRLDTSRRDEFAQLAKDFNTMTRRLNEIDELKRDFVSHVSHELKSPLASMRETIQLMLDQIPGPLTDKQKRLLELNLQSGHRLTAMIGNLLDLSRMEAGVIEYELKSQDLIPLVQNAIAEIEVQAHEKQIQIDAIIPEEPLLAECDGGRIMQVIVNLLSNAVKYSPSKTVVQVFVASTHSLPESMPRHQRTPIMNLYQGRFWGLVTVADSGSGIPASDKEKVFEKFHQIKKDRKTAGQGVGLGLAISRTIVEAHRGAIWVEDNPNGGSRFMILLPLEKMSQNENSQAWSGHKP
jgi:signal transduction histidine kinase